MDTRTESFVYFVKNESTGNVKIGFTTALHARFYALQHNANEPLNLLGVIPTSNQRDERELHRRFANWHVEGEWFRLNPYLAKFISHHAIPVEIPPIREGGYVPGPGRPKGSGEFTKQIAVRLTDEQYEYVMSQECSAAEYIRSLIARDAAPPGRPRAE